MGIVQLITAVETCNNNNNNVSIAVLYQGGAAVLQNLQGQRRRPLQNPPLEVHMVAEVQVLGGALGGRRERAGVLNRSHCQSGERKGREQKARSRALVPGF